MTLQRVLRALLAAGALALALAACGSDSGGGGEEGKAPASSGGTTDQIDVKDFAYKPEIATVKVGTKVTWTFSDDANHNVEAVGGAEPTKSPDLKDGGTYSFTFTTPGTVKYRCSIHNYMTGTVMVTA